MKFEWQKIHKVGLKDEEQITLRAKVVGGWVLKSVYLKTLKFKVKRTESLIFIPDEKHEWEIDK